MSFELPSWVTPENIITVATLVAGWFGYQAKQSRSQLDIKTQARNWLDKIYREDILPNPALHDPGAARTYIDKTLWTLLAGVGIPRNHIAELIVDDLVTELLTRLGPDLVKAALNALGTAAAKITTALPAIPTIPQLGLTAEPMTEAEAAAAKAERLASEKPAPTT